MLPNILAIVMMLTALLGGGGAATVYAAQQAMPDETLYPVKTWSEEMRLNLTNNPETALELHLLFAERRMIEIADVLEEDEGLAANAMVGLQNHLDKALEATGKVSQEQALPAIQMVQQRLQYQQMLMQQLMQQLPALGKPDNEALMTRTGERLREQLQVIENQLLEEQLQQQEQNQVRQQVQPGQQGQGQNPGQPVDPALLQNQIMEQVQNQLQNRIRLTLTPGIDLQNHPGKGPGLLATPQP